MKETKMEKVIRITGYTEDQILNYYYNSESCSGFVKSLNGDNISASDITSLLHRLYA